MIGKIWSAVSYFFNWRVSEKLVGERGGSDINHNIEVKKRLVNKWLAVFSNTIKHEEIIFSIHRSNP